MVAMSKRHVPYTEAGIKRVPCARCGAPSVHQWQICSDGRVYRGCCLECDIELQKVVLEFFHRIPDRAKKLRKYALTQRRLYA